MKGRTSIPFHEDAVSERTKQPISMEGRTSIPLHEDAVRERTKQTDLNGRTHLHPISRGCSK